MQMRNIRVLIGTACLLFATSASAQQPNLSGRWEAEGTREGRTRTWAINFDVKGDSFSGTWQSLSSKTVQPIANGTIKGNNVSFKVLRPNGTVSLAFTGTVTGDTMKLTMDSTGESERTELTAVRKKE